MNVTSVCVFSAVVALAVGLAAGARAEPPRVVALDPPAMGVRLLGGEARVNREAVRVRGIARLRVEPAAEVEVRDEPIAIADGTINNWVGGSSPAGVMSLNSEIRLWGCLKPGTLLVRSEKGGGITYTAGQDYVLDETWGAIARKPAEARKPEGRIPQGGTVFASYTYGLERLDTVEVEPGGGVLVRRGEDAQVCPLPARTPRGNMPLAHIYVTYHARVITQDLIYPIGPRVRPVISENADRFVQHTLAKLRRGAAVTVVFLGDSVTAGGNATSPGKRFPDLFAARLRRQFPGARVTMVNAGVGGTNSDFGLERLDKDVLAHKPDLVVVEFVNDMFWPPAKIRSNYAELVARVRRAGAEVIICTPHYMAPQWMKTFEPAAQILREAARDSQVGLADVSRSWGDLRAQGLPYMTLLANRINHPDNRGHRLFADALIAFFR